MKFKEWFIVEAISFQNAVELYGYKPGNFIEPQDFTSRFRKLIMKHHPDRGGEHEDMVNVSLAKDLLSPYIGKQIPGVTWSEPPTWTKQHWADPKLHESDRTNFGKWLHSGIVDISNLVNANVNSRGEDKLFNTINRLVDIISEMHRAFNEWKIKTREDTLLTSDDFYELLEMLEYEDSSKNMRAALKKLKSGIYSFYDKHIKDFPSNLA